MPLYRTLAALKFCFKTCVAMKFVNDDNDDDDDDDDYTSVKDNFDSQSKISLAVSIVQFKFSSVTFRVA